MLVSYLPFRSIDSHSLDETMVSGFHSVPADFASIKIQDAILTRLSNDDSIERSLSTFAQEMATTAMILGMTHKIPNTALS